jgi:hypothetical protein
LKINLPLKLKKMKTQLHTALTAVLLLSISTVNFAQAPPLGTAANFVLFTSVGAVTNSGITYLTHLTGNVGTNSGSLSGFGNVDGQMHFAGDSASLQCAKDLLAAYDSLNMAIPDSTIGLVIGNGEILHAGIYLMPGVASLNLGLTLDAKGDPNAVFIFKTSLAFSTSANSKIHLINGAKACNVFWKIDGAVSIGTGTTMRGTIISGGAISMSAGDTLEGRALTINGAVLTDSLLAYTPICGSPLTGPTAPALASTACYALFSSTGEVTNAGVTHVTGDIGTNSVLTTGFDHLLVTGTIHPIPDGSTAQCAIDLSNIYTYLNTLPSDIELLYPAQFGHNLVLTPHTYIMKAATVFTDTLYLNAQGNANAVFVIQLNGALSTSIHSKVKLINGTQAKNVYWKIDGAVLIDSNSVFNGTIICQGAISIDTGTIFNGSALTVVGVLKTFAMTIIATTIPSGCITVGIPSASAIANEMITFYPNPFSESTNIFINDAAQINYSELRVYNILGSEVLNIGLAKQLTTIGKRDLPSGIYFYKVIANNKTIQTGKLISQ